MYTPNKNNALIAVFLVVSVSVLAACSTTGGGQTYRSHMQSGKSALADVPGETYAPIEENVAKQVKMEPVSTFSIDVDTAAYANVRRFINNGHLPPPNAVRIEEMVNYFDYNYAPPSEDDEPFSVTTEIGPDPWSGGSYLLHIGIKGYEPALDAHLARNLVFLLDVSGSMDAPNKLELLKKSLRLLVNQLRSQDRVAIVVYAGASGLALPSTPGNHRHDIITALEQLHSGGSTNGGEGIQLAYSIAQENFVKDGVNRVILATDGDFNVGVTSNTALKQLIKQKNRSGVGLTVLGFGTGNYNDRMLEEISNAGDGNAAYIDTLQEAQKVLVDEIDATMQTIARDTKIQIEFNPDQVSSYRLIGYENRMLKREDFKDDRVDAGDVGAGNTVTALYEITLNDGLRYQKAKSTYTKHDNEIGLLKIRYKRPDESVSREMVHALYKKDIENSLSQTSDNFRFSAAVAAFGQRLRNSNQIGEFDFADILALARESRGNDAYGYRAEFMKLVNLSNSLN
ncbi:MAG: VWA domain-containing protein [Candidatus Thiodiazotropha sp.]